MPELILASKSLARAHLLRAAGIPFRAIPSHAAEPAREPGEALADYVVRLALLKASRIFQEHPHAVVLGADTALELEGQTLGKPADEAAAIAMLLDMAGRTHHLASGIAVCAPGWSAPETATGIARVHMRPWSRDRIRQYVHATRPTRFAGGYALQEEGAVMVEHLEGDPNTVIGLPMTPTENLLRKAGIDL